MRKRKRKLTPTITETEFDNGYWYATELRSFAVEIGIPAASRLRKDELEAAVKKFIHTGRPPTRGARARPPGGAKDLALGLRLDLAVRRYTSNRETKQFLEREAGKLVPGFKRAPGTRYPLNRWREQQLAAGRRITYRDLVLKAIELNATKTGPLRIEHGRYMNFVSDFMRANPGAKHTAAVQAWHEIKEIDAPKTYVAWKKARAGRKARRR